MDENKDLVKAYKSIGAKVLEQEAEMVKPESEGLSEALNEANVLIKKVKTANEGLSDARLLAQISYVGRKKVQELKTSSSQFIATEFTERTRSFLLQGQNEELKGEHWEQLGRAVRCFFKYPPHFSFISGSFHKEVLTKSERVKRQTTKDDNSKDRKTQVKQVIDDNEKSESTSSDVTNRVLPALLHCYKHNQQQPIDYMEFVVDPDCFGTTVENIFHVSFLIRDGYAQIDLDEDRLPIIKPTLYGEGKSLDKREAELQSLPRKQTINGITVADWKNVVRAYKIEKPRIPRRKKTL